MQLPYKNYHENYVLQNPTDGLAEAGTIFNHAMYAPFGGQVQPALSARATQSPADGRSSWSPNTITTRGIGSNEVNQLPARFNRSPSDWSEFAAPSDHLGKVTGTQNTLRKDDLFSSTTANQGLISCGSPNVLQPSDHSSGIPVSSHSTTPGDDGGLNDRVPPRHAASATFTTCSNPATDPAMDPAVDSSRHLQSNPGSCSFVRSPSSPGARRRMSPSPARGTEEGASDSGTGSGDDDEHEDLSAFAAPRSGGMSSQPVPSECPPQQSTSSQMSEQKRTTSTSSAEQARLPPWSPFADMSPKTGHEPDRVTPAESTPVAGRDVAPVKPEPPTTSRDPVPRFPGGMGAAHEEPKDPSLAALGITAELCSRDLWLEFHEHGTEMIITKMGRRMFPTVKVRLHGLKPSDSYIVYMDIVPVDDKRYRYIYHSSEWAVAGPGDSVIGPSRYVHPDSPALGRLWTSQGIVAFDKLKLTNRRVACSPAQISLHSMQKYRPRVHVQWTNDLVTPVEEQIDLRRSLTFSFRETEFITVTAYQNQEITRLKIASNPFAKGFRDIPASKR
ncbi:T-box transcription factor TBX18 [Amphibalanus amphitrite]|uniref:T-box transcription factor TBX18 n=1 Tax=Amphibalanus amphitrite TaxID=1232801 RepID=A0A6A4VUT9_AMPAM|nr:T-box transcription factor TBX18 [Amphibalanus amphitrite]